MEANFLVLIFIGVVCGDGLRYVDDYQGDVHYQGDVVHYQDEEYQVQEAEEEVVETEENTVGEKAADLTMFGETTGCGVNRDCLSCANDRHKGCTWYGNVGCVRARKPFQCTANPLVPGEVKEQCLAFQDCRTCTTQAGCVFYKGTCTYSAGTNCLEDSQCINYPTQCPNVPLIVEARMFNGGGYNPVLPPIHGPLGHPGPIQYQDISVMTDPYKNPFERQKRFHENMWANPNPPFGGLTNPNPPFTGGYNRLQTYPQQVHRPTVLRSHPNVVHEFNPTLRSHPNVVHEFNPTQRITPAVTPFNPYTPSFSPQPTSRVYSRHGSHDSRHSRRSHGSHGSQFGGHGRYNPGHNQIGHHYGWD